MLKIRRLMRRSKSAVRNVENSVCLWISALSIFLCGVTLYISQNVKTVYIKDGNNTILSYTLEKEASSILLERGIATMAYDVVDFTGFEGKMGVINISRAFPITLTCDGETQNQMVTEISVRELLSDNHIILSPTDTVNIPKAFYLSPHDNVVVTRVDSEYVTEREAIPFETNYRKTPLLRKNRTKVLSKGVDGELKKVFKNTLTDSEVTDSELIEEKVLKEPVEAEVLVGGNVPISNLDFGVPLDVNGNPIEYKAVLRNQICTGYWAGGSAARGASGAKLSAGSVAVRASQFPYGTKFYIKSADGSFVYGSAVAADTGLGLMQNAIDIDLFYDSYLESCLNGRKILDVYVL